MSWAAGVKAPDFIKNIEMFELKRANQIMVKVNLLSTINDVDHGSLVKLSRFSTVGSLMGNLTNNSMFIEGKIVHLVYPSLYRMHQQAIHGALKTIALWLAEKIMRLVRPRMKLH